MKKNTIQNIAILLLTILTTAIFAQDNRTIDTKVADILAQMPTKDLVHRDRVINEVIQLGPDGFQKFTSRLVPPGEGDDTAVRFVINSCSRYASEFGKEKEKVFVEDQLLKALKTQQNSDVKTFLLNELNLVGGDKTIQEVKIYLTDDFLAEPATQTILSVGGKTAAGVLLEALPKANDKTKPTLVKALGELKCDAAVQQITAVVNDKNPATKKVAQEALANIGDPNSFKTLLGAAKNADFAYEPTNAAEAFLHYADRLGEKNETELCKKACNEIFKANKADNKLHNYSVALAIY